MGNKVCSVCTKTEDENDYIITNSISPGKIIFKKVLAPEKKKDNGKKKYLEAIMLDDSKNSFN